MPNPTVNRVLTRDWRPAQPPVNAAGALPRGATRPGRTTRGTTHRDDVAHRRRSTAAVVRTTGTGTRAAQRRLPGNPAGAIYGSIITASLLAVETAYDKSLVDVITLIAATLVVFWIAHAYTDVIGQRVRSADGSASAGSVAVAGPAMWRHALREEWPIVESGILPIVVVLIASAFGAELKTALTVALLIDVAELFGWGALAARRMRLTFWRAAAYTAFTGLLGALLVLLKVLIH